jgi:hypothetical protein
MLLGALMSRHGTGKFMKTLLIVTASIFGVAGAAVAADLPVRQPPPPQPVVGVGKYPIGKAPLGKAPVVAPGPLVTK